MNEQSESKVVIKSRTVRDGSMIYFDPYKKPITLDEITNDIELTSAQAETVGAIIALRDNANSDRTITVADIRAYLGVSESVIKHRIIVLSKLKLLRAKPFCYADSNITRRVKLWEFVFDYNTIAEQTNRHTSRSQTTYNSRQIKNSDSFLSEFHDIPQPKKSELRIVTPKNQVFEQLMDFRSSSKNQIVKTFRVSGKKVNALIRSHSRIADMSDFKIYCAIVTLVYHYHQFVQKNYQTTELPTNRTPFHIDDVLMLIYPFRKTRRFSGEDRKRVRNAFQAIDDTTFEIIDKTAETILNIEAMGFTKNRAKIVKEITPFSNQSEVVEGDNIRFGEDATIYIVELQDSVFKALLEDATLFVLPQSVLGLPPILFALYLKLRAVATIPRDTSIKHDHMKMTLELIHQDIGKREPFESFKRSFLKELQSTKRYRLAEVLKTVDSNKSEVLFNLFGFHVVWTLKDDHISITLDIEEFLRSCDITAKSQRAPTMKNQLRDTLSPIFALQSSLVRKAPASLEFPINVNKYHIDFFADGDAEKPIQFSVYDDKQSFLELLGTKSKIHVESLAMFLDAKVEQLNTLTIQGYELTTQDMHNLSQLLGGKYSYTMMILMFARRRTLQSGLLKFFDTDEYTDEWLESVNEALNERASETA
ncbi:DUF3346 domain-containing protein [Vibrio fluvialis]|uniref:replication initiator protein RctB domain-containing protein n=1 Tax=Vibrio fluvialis TaxID=676 RepID=UPI0023A926DB|nr:replication initiator protein RctB domain-containing protein [Vibrio fluvialis]MDE5179075.1 DUF3346 domain-containing protein [Vibrio fluvialis]